MSKYIAKKPDKNGIVSYTVEENETWQILFQRQKKLIQNRACTEFIIGLEKLDLPENRIPQCGEVSEALKATTGWAVAPVETIIPLEKFFSLLANKQFPAATFIRTREEINYLQEPDIFHEFFGHCPMLTNPAYADFVEWYGKNALKQHKRIQSLLGRLFWFTIEFGLLATSEGLRIYGGGILSSYEETIYALENDFPKRNIFNILTILHTSYRYDEIQSQYYYLTDLSELFKIRESNVIDLIKTIIDDTPPTDFILC